MIMKIAWTSSTPGKHVLFVINAGFVRRIYSESLGQQACMLNASSHCKADSLLLTTETVDLQCHLKCHQQLRRNFDRGCLSLPSLLHHLCKGLSCSWTLQPNGQLQIKPPMLYTFWNVLIMQNACLLLSFALKFTTKCATEVLKWQKECQIPAVVKQCQEASQLSGRHFGRAAKKARSR